MEIIDWIGRFQILITLPLSIASTFFLLRLYFIREWRLIRNLSRHIIFYYPEGTDFETPKDLLLDSKIFKLGKVTNNIKSVKRNITQKKPGLIIIGYTTDDAENFFQIYNLASQEGLPVIVYTFGNARAITEDHKIKMDEYSYYSTVNAPLRLLNDVFTILSVFNYPKKW